ncbi:MAG: hypothetical protein K2R98_02555 [Gemmataceae bacterium]|nr:hypothetical protein [Gemmataceae bacterium]
MQAMLPSKIKMLVAAGLVLGLVASGVGALTYRSLAKDNEAPGIQVKKEEPKGGPIVNGLKLTVSAEPAETAMKKDGSNAEPFRFKLTFTNVSDKPIKLDAYDLFWGRVTGKATPPDADSIKGVGGIGRAAVFIKPVAADFPEIKPGQSLAKELNYTGWLPGDGTVYAIVKPGEFRFKFTYANAKEMDDPLAKGSWTGELASNELVIKVKADEKKAAGGPEVKGLKLTLSADKTETFMQNDGKNAQPINLKLTFTNVSDKPIKLNAHDFIWNRLKGDVQAPDAQSVQVGRVAADRIAVAPKAEDFPEIKPGQSWSFDKQLAFPGRVPLSSDTFATYAVLKPGDFKIKFTYLSNKAINAPFAENMWLGELVSNELAIQVKRADGK